MSFNAFSMFTYRSTRFFLFPAVSFLVAGFFFFAAILALESVGLTLQVVLLVAAGYSRIANGAVFHAFPLRRGLVFRVVNEPHAGRRLLHGDGHSALTAPFPHGLRVQMLTLGPFLH